MGTFSLRVDQDSTNGTGGASQGTVSMYSLVWAPFVGLVSSDGNVGQRVGILGQGFTGTTGVSFNGTSAAFTVESSTFITATVPLGATSGFVEVATLSGTLKSNASFRVVP
jgi:hypothetical protein